MQQVRNALLASLIFLVLAVILGAFGAHALEDQMTADQQTTWETANRYHFYHALGALALLVLDNFKPSRYFRWGAFAHLAGILFFSGSLYFLSAGHLTGASFSWMGPLTPLGGVLFIAGWICGIAGVTEKSVHV